MKKPILLLVTAILIFTLAACSGAQTAATSAVSAAQSSTAAVAADSTAEPSTTTSIAAASTPSAATSDSLAANSELHDEADDYVWDAASVIAIQLEGSSISASSKAVVVSGRSATIAAAGTYSLSGMLADGQIIVNTQEKGAVRLILNGADLHNSSGPAILVAEAKKVVVVLADGTQNSVSDGSAYASDTSAEDAPNAAIYSMSDLTIYGSGALSVTGSCADGIASKDGLIIASGTLDVTAADDGLRGKDYLVVQDGTLTVNAQGDGLKSDNEEDASKGFITIVTGVINVTSGGDAIAAQTDASILNGSLTLTTGGGSSARIDTATSAKGIKGLVEVNIDGGSFALNTADDAVHSNATININGGTFSITTGDDGMHADTALNINGGDIDVTESYEGLEASVITINGGYIRVNSSDDGINVASGNDGSGAQQAMGAPGGGGRQRPGGGMGGPGQDAFANTGSNFLYIHGGTLVVNAYGDGLDVNGAAEMTDGVVLVSGPVENMNGPLDHSGFNISGGLLVAAGSSGMAMSPSATSSQNSVIVFFSATQAAGSLVHIQNSAGEELLTFAPAKEYSSLVLSSPLLSNGSYTIFTGGSSSGSVSDMLYQGGSYSGGSSYADFTVAGAVTQVGSGGGRMR